MNSRATGRRRGLLVLALLAVALPGCLRAGTEGINAGAPSSAPGALVEEPFRTLEAGWSSGVKGEVRSVITNETEWGAFWSAHQADSTPPQPPPRVDFSRERVVAVFLGTTPNTCWAVRVANVTTDPAAGKTTVDFTTYTPGASQACLLALSQPHHVVAIPRGATQVVFRETTKPGPPDET
jgi:hypothetical protein